MPNMSMKKHEMPAQAPDVRNKNFKEVALGYSAETLTKTAHDDELPAPDGAYFTADFACGGMGSASCGPALPAEYGAPRRGGGCITFRFSERK